MNSENNQFQYNMQQSQGHQQPVQEQSQVQEQQYAPQQPMQQQMPPQYQQPQTYQQSIQGQPGYQQPYAQQNPQDNVTSKEINSLLITAIVGLIICAPLEIYVLIKGIKMLKRNPEKKNMVIASIVISIVALVIWVLSLIILIATGGLGI